MSFDPEQLNGLFANMQNLQSQLESAQAGAAAATAVGNAGGGAVEAHASGDYVFERIVIAPALVAEGTDVGMLEDLVLAAVRNAVEQLNGQRRRAIGGLMSGALGGLLAEDPAPDDEER